MKYEVKIVETKTYFVDVVAKTEKEAKSKAMKEYRKDAQNMFYNRETIVEAGDPQEEEEVADEYTTNDLGNNWY